MPREPNAAGSSEDNLELAISFYQEALPWAPIRASALARTVEHAPWPGTGLMICESEGDRAENAAGTAPWSTFYLCREAVTPNQSLALVVGQPPASASSMGARTGTTTPPEH